MNLVHGKLVFDEPRWCTQMFRFQCEPTKLIHQSFYQPLPKAAPVLPEALWKTYCMPPWHRNPLRLSLASFKVLANHFGMLEDADQPAIFDPKHLFIIFARYLVPVAYFTVKGGRQKLNACDVQLHCTLMYNPNFQQPCGAKAPARTRLEIIERLFYEQMHFTAVEMGFGITHNPGTCKCELCRARILLYFGYLPGVNPVCALAYLLEPTDSPRFLQGICDNHHCQCNIYAKTIDAKIHKRVAGANVFNHICPLKWDYVSKYHNKTIIDLSFAAADGNWRMKASTGEDYNPVQTLAGLAVTPPGLGLYRQAIPHGDLRWTLHLLKNDHWHWVKPFVEFSNSEEADTF